MRYVSFLRAINSGQNPSQKMESLRKIFEDIGLKNVKTVIASGNVVFESGVKDRKMLEIKIENALQKATGIFTPTITFTQEEIKQLVDLNPFKNVKGSIKTKPNVTFLKGKAAQNMKLPANGKGYKILKIFDRAICYVIDLSAAKTPDVMRLLEKEFGKNITTRTWNTVTKIASL